MIDSLFQEGTDQVLDDQIARPARLKPPSVGFWSGFASSAPRGAGAAVAESMAFGAEVVGAFGQGIRAMDQATPEQRRTNDRQGLKMPDFSNDVGDALRMRAREIMPDPNTTGTAGQLTAGLANFATKAVGYSITMGPLGPVALAGDVGMTEADRLKQEGVDLETRTKAGAAAGALAGLSVAVPLTGATAAIRFGKGAATGVGAISGTSAAERAILRAGGYDKIADTFDPFDPVALALGVVPGVIGAKFGRPVRTEAQMKDAARLTPAEQARENAYESSAANLRELEAAIKAEKRPAIRAELERELEKQRAAAGHAAVEAAVKTDPDLVPAARVMQTADALDASRLVPDTDLAGRDAHLSAVEMAADQMARGERVEVADVVRPADLPAQMEMGMRYEVALPKTGERITLERTLSGADGGLGINEAIIARTAAGAEVGRIDYSRGSRAVESFVDEAQRRKGIGTALYDAAELHGADFSGDARKLGTVSEDALALRAYRDARRTPSRTAAAADQLRSARTPPEPTAPRAAAKAPPAKESPGKPAVGPQAPRSGEGEAQAPSSVARAAEEAAAVNPDMLVHMEGMDAPVRVGDLLERVRAEAADDVKLGKLLEVAASCDLTA